MEVYKKEHKCTDTNHVLYYVIGNKCDLKEERKVPFENGQVLKSTIKDKYQSIDIKFWEISAKDGTNVTELLEEIKTRVLQMHYDSEDRTSENNFNMMIENSAEATKYIQT